MFGLDVHRATSLNGWGFVELAVLCIVCMPYSSQLEILGLEFTAFAGLEMKNITPIMRRRGLRGQLSEQFKSQGV